MGIIGQLAPYIDAVRDRDFAWGSNDCLTFIDGWLQIAGHRVFEPGWLSLYNSPRTALRRFRAICAVTGHKNVTCALDGHLARSDALIPPRGSVIVRSTGLETSVLGQSFGIVTGRHAAFLGSSGVEFLTACERDAAWIV